MFATYCFSPSAVRESSFNHPDLVGLLKRLVNNTWIHLAVLSARGNQIGPVTDGSSKRLEMHVLNEGDKHTQHTHIYININAWFLQNQLFIHKSMMCLETICWHANSNST